MGFQLSIGNAQADFDDPRKYVKQGEVAGQYDIFLYVPNITHWNAPSFPNAVSSARTNQMSRSYSSFGQFCDMTGLGEVLDKHAGGEMDHPDAIVITPMLIQDVAAVRFRWEHSRPAKKPAGYWNEVWEPNTRQYIDQDGEKYDYTLADLLWFEGWLNWAYRNVPYPCFRNS